MLQNQSRIPNRTKASSLGRSLSPKSAAVAALAPVPYTVYALRRGAPTICATLRRHPILFVTAWIVFAVHVLQPRRHRA